MKEKRLKTLTSAKARWYILLCAISFVIGVVVILQEKNIFLSDFGVLSRNQLQILAMSEFGWGEYAMYLLQTRLPFFLLLYVIGFEKQYGMVVLGVFSYLSFVFGMILTEGMVRYGIKGLAFVVLLGFPQYFLYLGSMIAMGKLTCAKTNMARLLVSLLTFLLFFGGIITESLLNTVIMRKILVILP